MYCDSDLNPNAFSSQDWMPSVDRIPMLHYLGRREHDPKVAEARERRLVQALVGVTLLMHTARDIRYRPVDDRPLSHPHPVRRQLSDARRDIAVAWPTRLGSPRARLKRRQRVHAPAARQLQERLQRLALLSGQRRQGSARRRYNAMLQLQHDEAMDWLMERVDEPYRSFAQCVEDFQFFYPQIDAECLRQGILESPDAFCALIELLHQRYRCDEREQKVALPNPERRRGRPCLRRRGGDVSPAQHAQALHAMGGGAKRPEQASQAERVPPRVVAMLPARSINTTPRQSMPAKATGYRQPLQLELFVQQVMGG